MALLALAGLGYVAVQQAGGLPGAGEAAQREPAPLPREDAVLVFGATGRMGRTVVQSVSTVQGGSLLAVWSGQGISMHSRRHVQGLGGFC